MHVCKETDYCMYVKRDFFMHVKKRSNACKETY